MSGIKLGIKPQTVLLHKAHANHERAQGRCHHGALQQLGFKVVIALRILKWRGRILGVDMATHDVQLRVSLQKQQLLGKLLWLG